MLYAIFLLSILNVLENTFKLLLLFGENKNLYFLRSCVKKHFFFVCIYAEQLKALLFIKRILIDAAMYM